MSRLSAGTVWYLYETVATFASSLVFTVAAVYFVTELHLSPLQLVLTGTAMELAVFVFEVPDRDRRGRLQPAALDHRRHRDHGARVRPRRPGGVGAGRARRLRRVGLRLHVHQRRDGRLARGRGRRRPAHARLPPRRAGLACRGPGRDRGQRRPRHDRPAAADPRRGAADRRRGDSVPARDAGDGLRAAAARRAELVRPDGPHRQGRRPARPRPSGSARRAWYRRVRRDVERGVRPALAGPLPRDRATGDRRSRPDRLVRDLRRRHDAARDRGRAPARAAAQERRPRVDGADRAAPRHRPARQRGRVRARRRVLARGRRLLRDAARQEHRCADLRGLAQPQRRGFERPRDRALDHEPGRRDRPMDGRSGRRCRRQRLLDPGRARHGRPLHGAGAGALPGPRCGGSATRTAAACRSRRARREPYERGSVASAIFSASPVCLRTTS